MLNELIYKLLDFSPRRGDEERIIPKGETPELEDGDVVTARRPKKG